jgi:hypothetical protein
MREKGVEIPYTRLPADVLRRVLEELVTRDGTDYGGVEKTLVQKVSSLARRLERGDAVITYDAETGTTNVVAKPGLACAQQSRASQPTTKEASDG